MTDEWHHCYGVGWTGIITPESFRHPAKISVALAERIYEHALDEGWVKSEYVTVTHEIVKQIESEVANGLFLRL